MNKPETFSIAELAREFSATTRAIRFYEDKGLIAPKRKGQRRIYSPRERVRLKLIMRGKRLGFSLVEIREILDLYDADPTEVKQLERLLEKIKERRQGLVSQKDDIAAILDELAELEDRCRARLKERS